MTPLIVDGPPTTGWFAAAVAIGTGMMAFTEAARNVRSGMAIMGRDRAERDYDTLNFWTITMLYLIVGCLFCAVGIYLGVALAVQRVPSSWWLLLSTAWAGTILFMHGIVWRKVDDRPIGAGRRAEVLLGISQLLVFLGLAGSFVLAIFVSNASKSNVPTATLVVAMWDHGHWYVTARTALLNQIMQGVMELVALPAIASGICLWGISRRERRIKPYE